MHNYILVDILSHSGHYISTINSDIGFRFITVNETAVKLEIWDTAGMEKHFNILADRYIS